MNLQQLRQEIADLGYNEQRSRWLDFLDSIIGPKEAPPVAKEVMPVCAHRRTIQYPDGSFECIECGTKSQARW
jgi:hypothetical protein